MPIVPATAEDLESIRGLLDSQGLPSSDIDAKSLASFLVWREGQQISGVVGLDLLGSVAMLRSLVVHPERRSAGLGAQLVAAAEALAARLAVSTLYLLTTDADRYFLAKGYRALQRRDAPPEIKLHPQFRSLCPSTSIFMSKAMNPHITGTAKP